MRQAASVRVRITAIATVVVAVAVAVAAFALVRTVENQLFGKLRERGAERVAAIANQLDRGVAVDKLMVGGPPPNAGVVFITDESGEVVRAIGSRTPDGASITFTERVLPGQAGNTQVAADLPAYGPGEYDLAFRGVATSDGALTVVSASPLEEVEQSIATLKSALVVGLPFLVALVGCVAWFMTGRALRPVEAIRTQVESISGGTLHRRVPEPTSGDEIARLAHTMNAMLDRLDQAAIRQRQFASDASHELRSPVATIRTELEVALRTDDADWPAVAERVLAEEDRLESLVTDLLLLATVDEGARPRTTRVDLAALVRVEAQRARSTPVTVESKGATVVAGRPPQLTRVVANLLDNACRHASSAVSVSVAQRDGRVRLLVDDDGPGIPVEDRDRVFERFTRLDASRSRRGEGAAGLGLALVRAVVDAHDGSVHVEMAPMGGARFVVDLPLSVSESDDRPAVGPGDALERPVGVDGNGMTAGREDGHVARGVGVGPRGAEIDRTERRP